jgi:hypothetical protein
MPEVTPQPKKPWVDYVNNDGCRIPSQKAGIRMFNDVPFPSEMSYEDKGKFLDLCKFYLVGDSGILGCASRNGPRAFNATEIGEIMGMEQRRSQQWVQKMCKLHVFHKLKATDGTYQYWVNPVYALQAGHRITLAQFLMFRSDMVKIITPYGISQLNRFARKEPMLKCNIVHEAEHIMDEEDDDQEA